MKRIGVIVLVGALAFLVTGVAFAFVPATGPEIDNGRVDLSGNLTASFEQCPRAQEDPAPTGPYVFTTIAATGASVDSSPLSPSGDNPFAPVGGDFNVTSGAATGSGLAWVGTGLLNTGVNAYGRSEMYMGGKWRVNGIPVAPGEPPRFSKARVIGFWWGIAEFNGSFTAPAPPDQAEARGFATALYQEYDKRLLTWRPTGDMLWANWEGSIGVGVTASGFSGPFQIHMGDAPGTGFPTVPDDMVKATRSCGVGMLPAIPGG